MIGLLPLAYAHLILAVLVVVPFLLHRYLVGKWAKRGLPPLMEVNAEELPNLTLVLPTWNESLIIVGKLRDVATQEYPREKLETIIIDAASDDDTIEKIEKWLEDNPTKLGEVNIIQEETRAGKSVSINRAFSSARKEAEILMMSDVDCRLDEGALMRVGKRMLDPSMGATTGRQVIINPESTSQSEQEEVYRDTFSLFRQGESCRDSTPIFHGECAAFRRSAIADWKLVEGANADDSQLAVAVRNKGLRSVWDPDLVFRELAPPNSKAQGVQKVRRAQGLVRHFWRNKGVWWRPRQGAWGVIMGMEGWMHIIAPWLVIIGFLAGIAMLGSSGASLVHPSELPPLVLGLAIVDITVLLLLIAGAFRLPIPLSGVAWTFLIYMLLLWRAQLLAMRGKSLHRWQQVKAVREQLANMEN